MQRRTASWVRADTDKAPDGGVLLELRIPRWRWLPRWTTAVEVRIPRDSAAVMQAQMTRILDGGQASDRFNDGQGLSPRYRGAVQ